MLVQLDSDFNSIFGVRSHRLVAEQGATSYFNSSDYDEEDEEECLLDDEDYYADDQEFFDLQELDFED